MPLPDRRGSTAPLRTEEADLSANSDDGRRRMIDRRSARTRASLHEALLSLMAEKGYEAVSVEEICARADVGRSTFYGHYTSKDDLLRSGVNQLRAALLERQRSADRSGEPRTGGLTFSLAMAEHARDHAPLHRALTGNRGGTIVFEAIREVLCEVVRGEIAATGGSTRPGDMPRELIVQYVVGAYMAVLTWWLDGKTKLAPDQIDRMFRQLTMEGVPGIRG